MCTHPLKRFIFNNLKTVNGKPYGIVQSYDTEICIYKNYHSTEYEEIPCGKCIECRLAYSREWANRMMLEATYHDHVFFLTLTYDQDHVPVVDSPAGGEIATLYPRDLELFWKRLRKKFGDGIRYYAAGEYGNKTYRPHYHAIVYGLDITDLEQFGFSGDYPVYISETIARIWSQGNVMIAPATWDTCAYTARYVLKKQKGFTKQIYRAAGIAPEFCRMSRRPGIGAQYFADHKDEIYKFDEIYLSTTKGGKKFKPPRLFDKYLEQLDERWYVLIKEQRKRVSECHRQTLLFTTKLSYDELLRRRENALQARIEHGLKRVL